MLFDDAADFVECVYHWLKGKVSVAELKREKCFVEGIKKEVHEESVSDEGGRRGH